jgi:organic radical activating enzyme
MNVGHARPFVVCTGGEPLRQLDEPLIAALHEVGFEIAIETNGTRQAPRGIDWICVSPKAGADLVERACPFDLLTPDNLHVISELFAVDHELK